MSIDSQSQCKKVNRNCDQDEELCIVHFKFPFVFRFARLNYNGKLRSLLQLNKNCKQASWPITCNMTVWRFDCCVLVAIKIIAAAAPAKYTVVIILIFPFVFRLVWINYSRMVIMCRLKLRSFPHFKFSIKCGHGKSPSSGKCWASEIEHFITLGHINIPIELTQNHNDRNCKYTHWPKDRANNCCPDIDVWSAHGK